MAENQIVPDFSYVEAAVRRLHGHAVKTPVVESAYLNTVTGGQIFIKPECLQRTGSFKFRGAWNRISQIDPSECAGGVVAYSSGNHAQGVAAAAQIRGLPAAIVMPADTPMVKKENTKRLGAEVIEYDRATGDRAAIAAEIAAERKAIIVPPFDDADIIAGQGTATHELVSHLADEGIDLDQLLVPAGGGGLIAGACLAIGGLSPGTQVFSVEPEGFDDHARSLSADGICENARVTGSICDALLSPRPGKLTFAVNSRRLAGGLAVSDDEVREAMRFAFTHLKLVVEPGGSVALAAVLSGKVATRGKTTGLILSGGNVDPGLFAKVL